MERESIDEVQFREGVRAGDPAAWTELYRRHAHGLARMARRVLASHMDADDAAAEAWLRGYTSAARYDPGRSPYPWLSEICLNVCLSVRRRSRGTETFPGAIEHPAGHEVADESPGEGRDALWAAVASLPSRPKEVVLLRFMYCLPCSEIARVLHVRENTVHQNLARGVAGLREGRSAPELALWLGRFRRDR